MATALFISRTDLVRNSIIDGSVDYDKIVQFLKLSQQIDIQNLLGTDLYNRISTDIENSTLSGDYLALVSDYIQPTLFGSLKLIIFHLRHIKLRMAECLSIQAKPLKTLIKMKLII